MPEEHRALVREARSVWEEAARRCANPYVDSAALLLVGRMTLEATRWEDGLVILQAIPDRIEPKSSPRRIPEWAREEGAKKRNTEHRDRKSAEMNTPWDPAALSAARAFLAVRKSPPRPVVVVPDMPPEPQVPQPIWTDEETPDLAAIGVRVVERK